MLVGASRGEETKFLSVAIELGLLDKNKKEPILAQLRMRKKTQDVKTGELCVENGYLKAEGVESTLQRQQVLLRAQPRSTPKISIGRPSEHWVAPLLAVWLAVAIYLLTGWSLDKVTEVAGFLTLVFTSAVVYLVTWILAGFKRGPLASSVMGALKAVVPFLILGSLLVAYRFVTNFPLISEAHLGGDPDTLAQVEQWLRAQRLTFFAL